MSFSALLSAQNLLIEQWTASTVDEILTREDRRYLDAPVPKLSAAYYSQAIIFIKYDYYCYSF